MNPLSGCIATKWSFLWVGCYMRMFTLLAFILHVKCQLPVHDPDPEYFPVKLRTFYTDLDSKFDCDFDLQDTCGIKASSSFWSFHQSLREMALRFTQAAEAAANALLNPNTNSNQIATHPKEQLLDTVTVNYYPCAVRLPGSSHITSRLSSTMELDILWPHFFPFTVPLDVSAASDEASLASLPNPHASPLLQQSDAHNSALLACIHLSLRFPHNISSQVELSFVSPIQYLDLPAIPNPPSTTARRPSDIALDPSTLSTTMEQPNTTTNVHVPRGVWIELTVPVQMHTSGRGSEHRLHLHNTTTEAHRPLVMYTGRHAVTWIVYVLPTPLRLRTSPEVCVDNFRFRVWAHKVTMRSQHDVCVRSIHWHDPLTNDSQVTFIDSHGTPVNSPDTSVTPTSTESLASLLHLYKSRTFVYGMEWLRFTGSLVLAISTTILFVLFVVALSVSILIAHRRRKRFCSPCRDTSRARRSSSNHVNTALLSESVCPIKLDFDIASTELEPESNSTQCNESLFLPSTDTYCSGSQDNQTEVPDNCVDATNTSAVQLMRNWYFCRRRARHRARQNCSHLRSPLDYGRVPAMALPEFTCHNPVGYVLPVRTRSNTAAALNPNRRSLIITTDMNNQLILLPEVRSDSAPSTSQRAPHTSSDRALEIIHETPSRRSHTLVDTNVVRDLRPTTITTCEDSLHVSSLTPSTVARSQLSMDEFDNSEQSTSAPTDSG